MRSSRSVLFIVRPRISCVRLIVWFPSLSCSMNKKGIAVRRDHQVTAARTRGSARLPDPRRRRRRRRTTRRHHLRVSSTMAHRRGGGSRPAKPRHGVVNRSLGGKRRTRNVRGDRNRVERQPVVIVSLEAYENDRRQVSFWPTKSTNEQSSCVFGGRSTQLASNVIRVFT